MTFTFRVAKFLALSLAQIPGFIAADVEKITRKIRQQFIVKTAQEGQGAGMIRGKRGRTAEKIMISCSDFSAFGLVRFGDFPKLLQPSVFQQVTQVAK